MPIQSDLSDLPTEQTQTGNPPVRNPIIVTKLAETWFDLYQANGDDQAPSMIEGARWRASWSGMCARAVQYSVRERDAQVDLARLLSASLGEDGSEEFAVEVDKARQKVIALAQTEPPTIADHWRFGIGSLIHEHVQAAVEAAFPGARSEVKVTIDKFGSATADLVIDQPIEGEADDPDGQVRAHHVEGGQDPDVLAVDGGSQPGLRIGGNRRESGGQGASAGVRAVGGADSGRPDDRSPVQGETLLQPGASGTSDVAGEHPPGQHDRGSQRSKDDLPERAPLRHGEDHAVGRGESAVLDLQQGVPARVDAKAPGIFRTVVELKTVGGFAHKMTATNFKGGAEGPRTSAILQGAVSAVALNADRLIIGYLSLENLSPDVAKRNGMDEVGRFAAEWHFTPEQFTPLAEAEKRRVRRILAVTDEGGLVPRQIPDLPVGARVDNPATGAWTVRNEEGAITNAGKFWSCGYCSHQSRCIADGAS